MDSTWWKPLGYLNYSNLDTQIYRSNHSSPDFGKNQMEKIVGKQPKGRTFRLRCFLFICMWTLVKDFGQNQTKKVVGEQPKDWAFRLRCFLFICMWMLVKNFRQNQTEKVVWKQPKGRTFRLRCFLFICMWMLVMHLVPIKRKFLWMLVMHLLPIKRKFHLIVNGYLVGGNDGEVGIWKGNLLRTSGLWGDWNSLLYLWILLWVVDTTQLDVEKYWVIWNP